MVGDGGGGTVRYQGYLFYEGFVKFMDVMMRLCGEMADVYVT